MSSWLGLSAAVGLGLALAVSAFARETGPVGARQFAAVPSDSPSPAPLAVFSKPHSARDALPAELVERAASLAGGSELPDAVRNGTLDLANAKLLLADVGSTHSNLYAFPTSKERVCYVLTAGPEGCLVFTREIPVGISMFDADGFDAGTPTTILGLVPNNVVDVEVRIGGQTYGATFGNNAYFFEPPSTTLEPEGLRVTFRSGRVTTITLPAPPAS